MFGIQCRGQRNGGGIGAAATERGDFIFRIHALVAGDHDHVAGIQFFLHAFRRHGGDACIEMRVGGVDAALRAGQRNRLDAHFLDRHRQQRHRDAFAGRQQHVEFAAFGLRCQVGSEVEQFAGGIAHRGDHRDHIKPGLAFRNDLACHQSQPFFAGDGAAAEFLYDDPHSSLSPFFQACRANQLRGVK